MNDFCAEPDEVRRAESVAAEKVLKSGWYILGKEVEAFEEHWARYCGTRCAIGVGNGMDALEIALRALKIGCGDEVIATPMTAAATVLAILRCGATPVMADIDITTGLLDKHSVAQCITKRTKAVLLVHLYGQVRDMEGWTGFCAENNLLLIEDCAQAHGAEWNNRKAGAFGACAGFSFYPTKNLGARGDGGAIVTDSEAAADAARTLRNYGQQKRYVHTVAGLNSRLDELQAALLSARLLWLDKWNAQRRQIAAAYHRGLTNPRVRPLAEPMQPNSHVYHLFVIQCDQRDQLSAHLSTHEIESAIHYPVPIHRQPFATDAVEITVSLPNAEQHAATCLSLPCHPQMKDNDIARVIDAVNNWRP